MPTEYFQAEDDLLFCESGCGRWYHIWCVDPELYLFRNRSQNLCSIKGAWGTYLFYLRVLDSFYSSYHSLDDHRLPSRFVCFDCRIRGNSNYAMIAVSDLLPDMISKYNTLVLFRYDIKLISCTAT